MRKNYCRRLSTSIIIVVISFTFFLLYITKCQIKRENNVNDQQKRVTELLQSTTKQSFTIPTRYLVVPYFEFVMRTTITCRIMRLDDPKKDLTNLHPKYSKYLRGTFPYVIPSVNISYDDVENFFTKILVKKTEKQRIIETSFAKNISFENIPYTFKDGLWHPVGVKSAQRTAIIVPLQGRDYNAKTFLLNMHAFLRRQQLTYTIVLVEQVAPPTPRFNKGRLYNTAVRYLEKGNLNITCLILHDVDLIPDDDRNFYSCERHHPKHTTSRVQKLENDKGYVRYYEFLVGGVLILTFDMYKKFNGFSNLYWGWGGEDDDLALRIIEARMCIVRPPYETAVYSALPHPIGKRNSARFGLLTWSTLRLPTDGYEQIEPLVQIVDVHKTSVMIHLKLDVDSKQNVNPAASANAIKTHVTTIRK